MNIELSPEIENFIQSKVKSGFYRNATEVIYDDLRHMEEQDECRKTEALRAVLMIGHNQADVGDVTAYSSEQLISWPSRHLITLRKGRKSIKNYFQGKLYATYVSDLFISG